MNNTNKNPGLKLCWTGLEYYLRVNRSAVTKIICLAGENIWAFV